MLSAKQPAAYHCGHGGKPVANRESLDLSASLNPLGPPDFILQAYAAAAADLGVYPDPELLDLRQAAAQRLGLSANQLLFASGGDELLLRAIACFCHGRLLIIEPSYSSYRQAGEIAGLELVRFPLVPESDFKLDFAALRVAVAALTPGNAVVLGTPNNPNGALADPRELAQLVGDFPQVNFIVDEAFIDFCEPSASLLSVLKSLPQNLLIIRSLTKIYAIPGLRLGFLIAAAQNIAALRPQLQSWPLNCAAIKVGAAIFERGGEFVAQSRDQIQINRQNLAQALTAIAGTRVFPGVANFILLQATPGHIDLAEFLAGLGIIVRNCANFPGLDSSFIRIAVRDAAENDRLIAAVKAWAAAAPQNQGQASFSAVSAGRSRPKTPTPALMIQGCSSSTGKSLLTAAFCRIFRQDGWKVAPFKAQNMSLNARITASGGEIGVAQYIQALAAGREPDVRMNPVLLKPQSDTGAALLVLGKPAGRADALGYGEQSAALARTAFAAYDELAADAEIMVMEGAGSPAEINLRQRDFVNMRAAIHAGARVLLAGDIDRGGVFANFIGHVATFRPNERRHLAGFLVNKFRGDPRLLGDAYSQTLAYTGYPVLGTIPYIHGLRLEEEDGGSQPCPRPGAPLQVAVIRLPHHANAQDFDPLSIEDDLNLEFVETLAQLTGRAWDALIIPGSRSSMSDLASLRAAGLADWIMAFAQAGKPILGICGGLQILGAAMHDPQGVESAQPSSPGLGLLDIETEFLPAKVQKRSHGIDLDSDCQLQGYEIHHGVSRLLPGRTRVAVRGEDGAALGFAKDAIWGCYLHGLFESDAYRSHWVNRLRQARGLPTRPPSAWTGVESELDRVAAIVRESCDLPRIYRELGLA